VKIELSKEALASLPAPDSQGMIRVNATLRVSGDGSAELMEVNDSPVGESEGKDDENPMPSQDLPDLSKGEADIQDPGKQTASLY
jgi:hypothetical protein